MTLFDNRDIELIISMPDGAKNTRNRFTPIELRQQINSCEIQAAVCRTFGNDDLSFFYSELAVAMQQGLKILLGKQPKATARVNGEFIDINFIKSNNDILNIAERYTKLRKTGKTFTGKCPIHSSKGKPLTIYPDQQSWYCYHCGKGGDVIRMVMHFENCDFKSAIGMLK